MWAAKHMVACTLACAFHRFGCRRAQQIDDHIELLNGTLCLEENATVEKLGKNAADTPNVNSTRVSTKCTCSREMSLDVFK